MTQKFSQNSPSLVVQELNASTLRVGLVDQGWTHHTVPPILLLVNFYLNEMTLNDILLQLLVSRYNRFISFSTM